MASFTRQIDDLLTFVCNTHRVDTGVATDADSVPSYRVYEDETTTPILTGSMALLDSANTAGLYSEQITLSAANGFELSKSYTIYISATVNGVTGTMSHTLGIETLPLVAATIRSAVGLASANLDTQLDALPTNTELATALGTADDATLTAIADLPTNAELATALGTADDATLAAIAAVQSDTNDIQSRLPAALSANGNMKADAKEVNDVALTGDGAGTPWGPV
jgi:hypothetical protein